MTHQSNTHDGPDVQTTHGYDPNGELRPLFVAMLIALIPTLIALVGGYAMHKASLAKAPVTLTRVAQQYGVTPVALQQGREVYRFTCAACHGQDAMGIARLGKPLRNNLFIQQTSSDDLAHFIQQGRLPDDPLNTTGVAMPARGGNPSLPDHAIGGVVAFLRTIQDPDAPPSPMPESVAVADGGAEGPSVPSGIGHEAFISACSACHGPDAEGLPNLGKPLKDSPFVASHSDEELIRFVKQGRPIWDAENTTGLDMPPKGGNPALSDDQIKDIVVFIKSLHAQEAP